MRRAAVLDSPALLGAPALPLPGLRPIRIPEKICQDLEVASSKEWMITNGLGGFASSTIVGMNTRRTHGLLVAASQPPLGRVMLLSKMEETLVVPGGRYELSTNRYVGVIHPEGFRYLVEFRLDPWPTFLYQIGDILLEKSVFLLPGENAVVVGYTLHAGAGPIELVLRPLVAVRDFRWVSQENDSFNQKVEEHPGCLSLHPYEGLPPLVIHHTAELVEHSPCWYKNFEYLQEDEARGTVREDLWSPGQLLYLLKVGESCALVASTGRRGSVDLTFHKRRLENTQTLQAESMTPPGKGPLTIRLCWTADSFVAHRLPVLPAKTGASLGETHLLAGFPWFTSWGRDALIALPGIALTLKRFDLARSVLETLASKVKDGLVPVRFAEEDGSPEYDSADTSLWFFWTVWQYLKATRDRRFVAKKLLDPMKEIIEGYLEGASFGIAMEEDGLISLSDEELPLTWMDGREPSEKPGILGKAVTPRFGKPVEVNALWYCALNVMATFLEHLGLKKASTYQRLSRLVQGNFSRTFFNPSGALYDRVTSRLADNAIRPNMLIAASLPFTPLSRAQVAEVLEVTERTLLTPMGVRTLNPDHPQYQGRYAGDPFPKAHAYHQGTVWAWLLGPYATTLIKARGLTRPTQLCIQRQLSPFLGHLEEGCLGSIGELFDGNPPHTPRGGISMAWSLGEILRVIQEAKLGGL